MALMRWPDSLNGIPLSERTQWLLFAPTWMLFPNWSRQVMSRPIDGDGLLRRELWPDDGANEFRERYSMRFRRRPLASAET